MDLSLVYDPDSDTTEVTFPYAIDTATESFGVVLRSTGVELAASGQTTTTCTVGGDQTAATLYGGTVYEMVYTYTTPIVKRDNGRGISGEYSVPQTVRFANVQYAGTRTLIAEVTLGYRATKYYELPGVHPDTAELSLDAVALHDGEFQVPIMGPAADATLVLRNATPYPSNVTATSWEINYHERARRI